MEREEISGLIENKYSDANQHFVTRVMCNNDITHYGYFNSFDDYTELKAKNQYRFIPRNNYLSLKNEYSKKGKYNTSHSIILKGEEVLDVEFVLPLHI